MENDVLSLKDIKLNLLRNNQDCLMVNIGEVCKALDIALPFTTKKNELMKIYLSLDEDLKCLLKAIDKLEEETDLDVVTDKEEKEDIDV